MTTTPTPPHSLRTAAEPDTVPDPPPGAPDLHETDGHQPLRRDGDLLLTGRARFVDDIAPRGLMHAAILRSPHPHALIRGVDATRARERADVEVVLTGADAVDLATPLPHFFEPSIVGCRTTEFRCLATDRVRWVGEPVAAVVATSLAAAEAALDDIVVDYEPLPAVLDADEALREDAPVLFEEWGDNRLGLFPFAEGDAAAKIAAAPHVIRDELRVGRQHVAPMETRGYVAEWEPGGRLTLWASTQNPHPLRTNLATTLGVPEDRVRVVATRMGGGFGHKFNGYGEEPLVCLLSRLADAPVKWIETRKDCLLVGAREFTHRFEVGFDDDGVVLGLSDRIVGNIGCLAPWGGWSMTFPAGMTFPGPYRIADYAIESVPVVTNKAPWNGFRGYGKEQAAMALERIMDLVAEHRGIDPAEVRRRNFIPPEAFPFWTAAKHLDSGEYAAALDKALALAGYDALRERQAAALAQGRHLGVGIGFELTPEGGDFAGSFVRGFDTSTVRVHPSGAVSVLTGVTSPGTGNETSIAHLVAREFGIAVEAVGVTQGDTDSCPYGFGNFTSRSLATGGAAAVLAARELRERMADAASALLDADAADFEFRDGAVVSRTAPETSLTFAELAETIYRRGLAAPGLDQPLLEVTRIDLPHNFHHVPDDQGRFSAYPSFPYSAHVALVEVDAETGVVEVLEYSAIDDCGVVISPGFVAGQLYGAIAQGIGGALWEEVPYDEDGAPAAETFKHYLTPRAPDLPSFRLEHQHTPSPFTLLGTKGAGESGVGGAMAALLNAVNDGLRPLGVHAHRVPLTPPVVLDAIVSGGAP
ncbi:xanthine dehydrogenase molybdenum binding subunit apoprotein [Actinomycetospora succinea]|uniref:Xanthine dehydrogenase molybdenum binding subunit apoprotein n=1 Tax=Actinomycetospora succinea TaxID=663603 RepID=A0A4V3DB13_9PSEU|nr:xanthine dehydrogenase family protein molybdopterin-binding subunit [Actinomycetospora succinea]TDQ64778.1 xanthine dehydrogenase molybdenum binding subunit apoprotein [Actinomycetospora succinea]